MAPSPGTPVGGERPCRRRSDSPRSPRAAAAVAAVGDGAGPSSLPMEVDNVRGRVYCPVTTCPCSDAARAPGWQSVATMRDHVDAHLSGALQGDIPATWLQTHGRQRCPVCGLSVSTRHGAHPTCRPTAEPPQPQLGVHVLQEPVPLYHPLMTSKRAKPEPCGTSPRQPDICGVKPSPAD